MSDKYKFLKNIKKSKPKIALLCLVIFLSSFCVAYLPLYKKGVSFGNALDNLVLARNFSATGQFVLENQKNVSLATNAVAQQGVKSELGNKLTPTLYAWVFNVFGFNQKLPNIVAAALFALSLVVLFLLTLSLFGLKTAILFYFLTLFLPLFIQSSMRAGLYEWAFLFSALGFLFYFLKTRPIFVWLLLSSSFLGLAFWARNSFVVLFIVFLVWELWQKKSLKRLALFVLPFLFIVVLPLSINHFKNVDNTYISGKETTSSFMHLFPDAYTWHYQRDAYVVKLGETSNYDYNQFLEKYGYDISLKNRLLMYWSSAQSYLEGILAQTVWGGAIILFFVGLGIAVLYNRKKRLLKFFGLWFVIWYIFLIVAKSNHWGHFLLLLWPAMILAALGLGKIIQTINGQQIKDIYKKILVLGVLAAVFLNFAHSNKWSFHELYENSSIELAQDLGKKVESANLLPQDVLAVGVRNPATLQINWQANVSAIYFAPQTVEMLLEKNKLKEAFEQFGATKIIGYENLLSQEIAEQTGAKKI